MPLPETDLCRINFLETTVYRTVEFDPRTFNECLWISLGVGRRVGPKNAGSGMEEERRNVEEVGGPVQSSRQGTERFGTYFKPPSAA